MPNEKDNNNYHLVRRVSWQRNTESLAMILLISYDHSDKRERVGAKHVATRSFTEIVLHLSSLTSTCVLKTCLSF